MSCVCGAPCAEEVYLCLFFNDTATTEIYTLSLHDALPISIAHRCNGSQPTARDCHFRYCKSHIDKSCRSFATSIASLIHPSHCGPNPACRLFKHLQVQRLFQQAIHSADAGERPLERGSFAGLDGDYEWQSVLGIARLLHDGPYIDMFSGERAGNLRNNSRPVVHQEPYVVGNLKLSAHRCGRGGDLYAPRSMRQGEQVADNSHRRGMAAGAVT